MTQKSQNQKHKPSEPNKRYQYNTNDSQNETYSNSHIKDEAEIKVNNLKTCILFYL